jgi:hypothetical protein
VSGHKRVINYIAMPTPKGAFHQLETFSELAFWRDAGHDQSSSTEANMALLYFVRFAQFAAAIGPNIQLRPEASGSASARRFIFGPEARATKPGAKEAEARPRM